MDHDHARTSLSWARTPRCASGAALSKSNTVRPPNASSSSIDIDDAPPCAILFDGRGEFLSGEALRWCTRRGVVIVMPDGPGSMMTLLHSAAEASDSAALRDVGPAIIRAQCAADPVQVAREIVRAKIAADVKGLGPRVTPATAATIARCEAELERCAQRRRDCHDRSERGKCLLAQLRRDLGLIPRRGADLPRSWTRFANRNKGAEFLGNKHASHPINAMLNYCIVVEAGRLGEGAHG